MNRRIPGLVHLDDATNGDDQTLLSAARRASENAYAPYSHLRVGAAVRTALGNIFAGCNVENASYGARSTCAEQNAIATARLVEGERFQLVDVALHAESRTAPPCGGCRQVAAEFGMDARVLFPHEGGIGVMRVRDLLPVAFELDGGA